MKYIYAVDNTFVKTDQDIRMLRPYRVNDTNGYGYQDLVQVVRAPCNESSIELRRMWEAGDVYFPTLWVAPNGIYENPVTIVVRPELPIVVKTHIKKRVDKNYQLARHIALLDVEDKVEVLAVRVFPFTPPPGAKLIGIYRSCHETT